VRNRRLLFSTIVLRCLTVFARLQEILSDCDGGTTEGGCRQYMRRECLASGTWTNESKKPVSYRTQPQSALGSVKTKTKTLARAKSDAMVFRQLLPFSIFSERIHSILSATVQALVHSRWRGPGSAWPITNLRQGQKHQMLAVGDGWSSEVEGR
jgi:hypothetical protein